jgi:hypothetical protein
VRCGNTEGVVGAHYTGIRRLAFGGGFGIKVHDFLIADLCQECHRYMDTLSRKKDGKAEWLHSEEFLYYIALTWERRFIQGVIAVARGIHGPTQRPVFLPPSGEPPEMDGGADFSSQTLATPVGISQQSNSSTKGTKGRASRDQRNARAHTGAAPAVADGNGGEVSRVDRVLE